MEIGVSVRLLTVQGGRQYLGRVNSLITVVIIEARDDKGLG